MPPSVPASRHFHHGAERYHSLSPLVWEPIGRAAAGFARAGRGDRVLDACCGTGGSAFALAEAVGSDGVVDAIDAAAGLIEIGCRLAAVRRLEDVVTFRTADVTAWTPTDGGRYDRLVCVLAAFLLTDGEFGDLVDRTVRPGGRVVVTSWTERGMRPIGPLLWDAVQRHSPSAPATPLGFAMAQRLETQPGLRDWADGVGLTEEGIVVDERQVRLDDDQAWALCTGTGFAALLDGLPQPQLDLVRADVVSGMTAAGGVLDLSVRHLIAHRPER